MNNKLSITSAGKMASSTTPKDAPSKLKSKVWEHFGFCKGSDAKATCKTCFVDVSYPYGLFFKLCAFCYEVNWKLFIYLHFFLLNACDTLCILCYCPLPVSPQGTYDFHSVCVSVCQSVGPSVCYTFLDFLDPAITLKVLHF